jgi:hypothetical protein
LTHEFWKTIGAGTIEIDGTKQDLENVTPLGAGASMAAPALTRRRSKDASEECWQVYYGDVRVGTIAIRSGNPFATDPWQWRCGFYPGSLPGDCASGTAASFGEARDAFELAWRVFLANRTEADFDEYRKHRAWTAWKYAMWDSGCKLPTQFASGRSICFCAQ